MSVQWDEMFPGSHLRTLGSDVSDYCPLLLNTNMGNTSKARFHFELFWPQFDDFEQVVTEAWNGQSGHRGPMAHLNDQLRHLVRALQSWSATKIGGVKEQLLMARELIHCLDLAQEERQLSEPERELRKRMKLRCLGLASLERTIARQRSRIRHLADGDANTRYFHLIARGRK